MAIDISNRPGRPVRRITISSSKKKKGLSGDILKIAAVVAMTLDHIAWSFLPFMSLLGQILHIIGRIAAPIMCFMVAEGYCHTGDAKKYAQRLGIFALISHLPFTFFNTGGFHPLSQTSVIFPLFLGLLALMIHDSPSHEPGMKAVLFLIICVAALIGDWGAEAVVWIYMFYINRSSRKAQIKYFCIISALAFALENTADIINGLFLAEFYQLGVFLCIPLLMLYNGQRSGGRASKWFFYVYYPAHLTLLGLLRYFILPLRLFFLS